MVFRGNVFKSFLLCVICASVLSSCSNKDTDVAIRPASTLYNEGLELLENKKFSAASKKFNKIFYQHPGGDLTPQAEIMEAYSLFLDGEYEEAVDIIDIFIKLHPGHKDIAYVYYLKALCFYMGISNDKLDQSASMLALRAFEDVVNRFADTKYAIDSALKLDLVKEHIAGKEMYVGRYYLKQKNPVAAINRFKKVVNEYPTTIHIEEALYRMVEASLIIGIEEEAVKYASVLGHNYSSGQWYSMAYDLLEKSGIDVQKKSAFQ